MNPTTGRVLKSVFCEINVSKPAFQFWATFFQSIGSFPNPITRNIFVKVMYDAPKQAAAKTIKIIFSGAVSNFFLYEINNVLVIYITLT